MDNSTPPQTTNQFATIVDRILSGVIEGAAEGEVEALIFAAAPTFFAIPVIGWISMQLVKMFVSRFGTYFYQVAAKAAAQVIVDIQADNENSKTRQAASALQDAIERGNQSEIDQADQDLEDAWGNLIHMDGSASP